MEFCLFQLYAPLVSWGEIAVGVERRSAIHPSKSAIIGLLGAALGINRDDEVRQKELADAVGVGVKVISSGTLLKDFHTIQAPKDEGYSFYSRAHELALPTNKKSTIISKREYRCDALSMVAIWLKSEEFSLLQIVEALKKPHYHLYLGRKSNPLASPLQPQIVETPTLKGAFRKTHFFLPKPLHYSAHDKVKKAFDTFYETLFDTGVIHYFWEECGWSGFEEWSTKTPRYDVPISRKRWQFSFRDEYMKIEERGDKSVY